MKQRQGKCVDCGPSSMDKPLIAKRCHHHYWLHRSKESKKKPKEVAKKAYKETLAGWFDLQIRLCPKNCENCGEPIGVATRTNIAHIVPKSIFSEVSMHPLNRWFACWQCHTNYDQWPAEKVAGMPVTKIARARAGKFLDQILQVNKHRVPEYLRVSK